ncbi:DUF115 domain-containing protein [Pseudoalteromonas sp. B137]
MNTENNELKKMVLRATLLANMTLLKEKMPTLYDFFKNYHPTNTGVVIDDNGDENLYNNSQFVYKEPPQSLAKKQVTKFLEKPAYYSYEIGHQSDEDIAFKHAALLKSIYNVRSNNTDNKISNPANESQLDFVCFLGGGLGYQIEVLLSMKSVPNVFLFEPNKDSFYALLHCIELRPLFEKCTSKGGRFSIRVGGDEHNVVNEISSFLFQQGHFNMSVMYFFKHYDSPLMTKIVEKIKVAGHSMHAGWGFFEDEIIGLSHTLANLNAKFPILKKPSLFKNPLQDSPVFVVANGPSLDLAIDFLKENQENVIIISCGTALKALLVNKIVPDIHVEMERLAGLLDWVNVVERTNDLTVKLKDLNIVALNTVYDEVLKRFKTAYLLPKVSDCGGSFIRGLDMKAQYTYPEYINPTVSNTSLAIADKLGFKDVYLVGMDFGFVSLDNHHSKHSIYFDSDFKHKELMKKLMKGDMYVKGNFRDRVLTTYTFDSSKLNIELLLEENKHIHAFNTSDGAFISNTIPMKIADIEINEKINNKKEKITKLLKKASSLDITQLSEIDNNIAEIKTRTKLILGHLISITTPYFNDRENLANAFTIQNKILLGLYGSPNHNDVSVYWLIQGTFRYFQTYIMVNTYYYSNSESRAEFMNACIDAFHNHLNDIYIEFVENYNKPAKV